MSAGDSVHPAGPTGLTGAQQIKFLLRDAAFYGVASVANKAFFLVTLPVLARHFGVDTYGSIDFLYVLILFLTAVVVLGQDSALARHFWEDTDPPRRRQLVTQALLIQVVAAVAVAGLLWSLIDQIPVPLAAIDQRDAVLVLAVLHLPFMALGNFAQGLLKWTFARTQFAIVTLGQTALNTVLLISAVFWLHATVIDVFVISLSSRAAFAVIGLLLCRHWLAMPRRPNHTRALLAFGLPFGLIGSIGTFVPLLERTTVGSLMGTHSLGLYAAGATIALTITLPIQAFQMAWGPFALAIHQERDAARTFDHVLKGFAVLCCLSVVALSAVGPLALEFLAGSEYLDGVVVVLPLALGLAIQGISWITEIGITLSKATYLQLPAYGAFLVAGGLSIALLAGPFGIAGVAVGVLFGHMLKAIVATTLAQRAYPLAWSFGAVAQLVATTLLLASVVSVLGIRNGAIAGASTGAVVGGFLALFAWTRLLGDGERAQAVMILNSARRARRDAD